MPDKITLDDALKTHQRSSGITIDDALKEREASRTPQLVSLASAQAGARQQEQGRLGPDAMPGYGMIPSPEKDVQPATDANFGAALKENLVEDVPTKRRLIAESLFPNDPSGINRVGFADGKPVYVDDEGKLREVSGPLSRFGAAAVANAPETAAAIAGAPAGVPGATAGAMGARGLKRAVAGLVFDEPQTIEGNLKDIAGEGALEAATGGLARGVSKFADRGRVVDFSPANRAAAEAVQQRVVRNTGVTLDLAQASGDRKLIALRAYAARYPGKSAELMQAADEASQGQFENATQRVLNLVAQSQPSEVAGAAGINAAQMTLAAARRNVSQSVRPLYEAAYRAVPEISQASPREAAILDFLKLPYFQKAFASGQKLRALETGSAVNPMTRTTETLTRNTDEAIERASTTVQSTSTGARRITSRLSTEDRPRETADGILTRRSETVHSDITRPSLAELDYTKRALDEMIEQMTEAGQRQRARALKIQRDRFVAALDALPNQQWQAARQEYAELARSTIEPLENGVVGVIAKIKSPKAATAAAKILQDPNVTPSQIAVARQAIQAQSPEAWNGMVRQWLSQKWNQALKETQTGEVVNPAGKFRQAVFGTPQDRAKALVMLPEDAARDFENLMEAAEKLASTPIAGSNTMRDTEIKDQLKGTGAVIFRWLTSPRQQVVNAAEQRALENGTTAITEAMLDPAKRAQLRRVVKMKPSTRQAILISSILAGKATAVAADSDADVTPPELERTGQ